MDILFVILTLIVACFSFVLLFGAPYLPTRKAQIVEAFKLLDLQPGQTMMELGCGDGAVLIAGAKRGYNVIGYELNPILFVIAWIRTRKYREYVTVRMQNFWQADLSDVDGVYVFLLDKFMERLDTKLKTEAKTGTKLVSYTFTIPEKKPHKKHGALFLYHY